MPLQAIAEPHWIETAYWISQILLMIITPIAILLASRQVSLLRQTYNHGLLQSKANFLLEIDRRWESHEMIECRKEFRKLYSEVKQHVDTANKSLDARTKKSKLMEAFSEKLYEKEKNDLDSYRLCIGLISFYETLGLMVKRGYADWQDIQDLFLGAIHQIDEVYSVHLKLKAEEPGAAPGLYENTLYLIRKARSAPDLHTEGRAAPP